MLITTGIIRLELNDHILPTDIEIIGLHNMVQFINIKYKINDKINYFYFNPEKTIQYYLFFELIKKNPLWSFNYNVVLFKSNGIRYIFHIKYDIVMNSIYITNSINSSMSLNLITATKFELEVEKNNITDFLNKSLVPNIIPINQPDDIKISLYDYQKKTIAKMIDIEKNQNNYDIEYTYKLKFDNIEVIFDPISNTCVNKEYFFKIKTKGGMLSDEMGLGKTISTIGLITLNQASNLPNFTNNKINTKATLIMCPSHLTKQWKNEIIRTNPKFKILTILSKTDYNHLIFDDFINADIIITSHQFIMNFKFYPSLYYIPCTPTNYNYYNRIILINKFINETILTSNFEDVKKFPNPIFEFFNFHRLILDEGHEILGEMLSNITISRYMSEWVTSINSTYYWYISGTPFLNLNGIKNCARFINLYLEDIERNITFNLVDIFNDKNNHNFIINKSYIWDNILKLICIKHRRVDIQEQVKIYGYDEEIVWLNLTDLERQLYDSKKSKASTDYLQQLCCHPLVVESSKKIFGNVELDLDIMQDKLIIYHKDNYEKYLIKLSKLDPANQSYHMLKKSFETQISESKYLFTILEKMKNKENPEENCPICLEILEKPTLTQCGHLYCYNCIKSCLSTKKFCPLCKVDLTGKDLLIKDLKQIINDPIIQKYGSKLGKLITIVKDLLKLDETRIIIFSQWDDMLSLVSRTLSENNINKSIVKGNVHIRTNAIAKFKLGIENKVIMLSLKNAASGTNLTEATHIFFVEPINSNRNESIAIENQAIARACRIGQQHKIKLIRILIKDTIEEDIYKAYYNKETNSQIII